MPRFIAVFSSDPISALSTARSFTPRIELCPPHGILLQVSSRSEQRILEQFLQQVDQSTIRTGRASTRIAALFAARARPGSTVPSGKERAFLAPLPVRLLSIILPESDSLLLTLSQWGIRTLGELAALPPEQLVARLGQTGHRLQEMARGQDVELFQSDEQKPDFEENQTLEWTLDSLEPLTFILGRLLDRLCRRLHNFGLAADSLQVTLHLDNGTLYTRTLQLAFPMQKPKILLSLLRLELQSHPPDAGILEVSVRISPVPSRTIQYSLLEAPIPSPEKWSRTLGRLKALLGEENIGSPVLLDTHRSDVYQMRRPGTFGQKASLRSSDSRERVSSTLSLRRCRPPRPIQIRSEQILKSSGPWRSSGEWWAQDQQWSRDEWDIELIDGTICRICWDRRQNKWLLEGIYD